MLEITGAWRRFAAVLCLLSWVSPVSADDAGAPLDAPVVRPAVLAGSWYPGDAPTLRAAIDGLLADAQVPESLNGARIAALVVPHAGLRFSGATAASGFRLVQGRSYDRVIVIAPAHRGSFAGLAVPPVDAFQTLLGGIPVDREGLVRLRESPLVDVVPGAHAREHAIEMELPFLQRALMPGWKLLPVLVGRMDDGDYAVAADAIRPLADERTLVVVSSDFTHYGPRYGYQPFPPGREVAERIRRLDMGLFELMWAFDVEGLLAYQRGTGITACGFGPLMVLTHLLDGRAEPRLIRYATSGELTGSYENSVSYLAAAYVDGSRAAPAPDEEGAYRPEELELLHGLARRALAQAVEEGAESVDPEALVAGMDLPPRLTEPTAAFVTLRKEGRLRGCIGDVMPIRPLYASVVANAVNAGLRDRRFRPVTADELPALVLEISVLTPPRSVASYEDYDVKRQGIILRAEGHRAVYLPEVARSMGWDRSHTLSRLAQKAGLEADAWKTPDARFAVFSSIKYAAPMASDGAQVARTP
jgi:hypothetical protein